MGTHGYTWFDTALGRCGIAWGERGICRVQLPEASAALALGRLLRQLPEARPQAPPPDVLAAITRVQAMLAGAPDDLADIALDMQDVPGFHRRVYAVARAIGPGATLTYGEVAARLGEPGAARAVGQAPGHNPFAPVVPCHRVLAAGGRSGGFSARGGVDTKLRMLMAEGAAIGAPGLFDGMPVAHVPIIGA